MKSPSDGRSARSRRTRTPANPREALAAAQRLYDRGQYTRLRAHLAAVPVETVSAWPQWVRARMLVYEARCHQFDMHLLTACDRLREAIALFEHQQLHEEIAEALLTLADVYRQMRGRYVNEGERVLDSAYQTGRLLPDSPLRARLLMRYHRCKGRHLLTAGDSAAALEQFAHAQRIAQVEDDCDTQALMHIHLAHCHALHGDSRTASA